MREYYGKKYDEANKEKKWGAMLEMVVTYMKTAEGMFKIGAQKKEWVFAMAKVSADTINYDIDLDVIGKMIDDLCDMSNVINPPTQKTGEYGI